MFGDVQFHVDICSLQSLKEKMVKGGFKLLMLFIVVVQ